MGEKTKVEWCRSTFNTWWGCTTVSEACRNCYAESFARRTGHDIWGAGARRRFFGPKHWNEPLKWNAQARKEGGAGGRWRVFCSSMADVFEQLPPGHPDDVAMAAARAQLWTLIGATPWLDWLLLTKRPQNVEMMVPRSWWARGIWPLNVWVGTTVENRAVLEKRMEHLRAIPAPVRFVSAEPLLESVSLAQYLTTTGPCHFEPFSSEAKAVYGEAGPRTLVRRIGVEWVIVGGESGGGARPMHPGWVRSLQRECAAAGAPFFFKQWGDWKPVSGARPTLPLSGHLALSEAGLTALEKKGGPFDPFAANHPGWVVMKRGPKGLNGKTLDGRIYQEVPIVEGIEAWTAVRDGELSEQPKLRSQ